MKNKILFIGITGLLLFSAGCTDGFEEMNKDPFNPTTTTIEPVFNRLLSSLPLGWQERAGLHNTFYYYYNQQAGRFGISGYNLDNSIGELWSSYYQALSNYRLLQRLMDGYTGGKELTNLEAMSKILMAYKTLKMVETFGDIPYSKAGRAVEGAAFFRVEYDDDHEIYLSCLEDLKWASDNLNDGANQFSPGSFDTVLGSDINSWKKWANSLILRHALRIYDVEQQFAGALIADVLGNPSKYPVIEEGEDMGIWPKELSGVTLTGRGWSFWSENMIRMGTSMWNVMSVNDNTDGSGIFDPRCHVFFEPNNGGEWVPFPQNPTASTPPEAIANVYKTSRDDNWYDKGSDNLYSPFNYFLVRDEYSIPELIQTAAEVNFLKAEAYAKGAGVPANMATARAAYETGIKQSIKFWYFIVGYCDIWTVEVPVEPTNAEIDAFIAHPVVEWQDAEALDLIYTQRWVETFRQPWEGFHLWNYTRKTPRDMSGDYVAGNYDFFRLHYPFDEQLYNYDNWAAATNDGATDKVDVKLFWQK